MVLELKYLLFSGVVRESGRIVKCFDEMCGDFLVSDEIKKVQFPLFLFVCVCVCHHRATGVVVTCTYVEHIVLPFVNTYYTTWSLPDITVYYLSTIQLLIMEDSDNYDEYSEEERAQFLFRILKHLVLGGPVNQV